MGLLIGEALFRVRGDASGLRQDFSQMKTQANASISEIGSMASRAIGAITAVAASAGSMIKALRSAGQFEQTTIAFETMLGSAEETKQTMADLTEFAALTPFEMPEIEQAARGLIQFGERGEELMDTLKMLGDAASGTSTPFGFLALVFNQVRGVGKLLTQDFRQLSTRGIMSLQDIADYYGVATAEAQKMLSTGKVSFEDLKGIFKMLTSEGGRFANMMERQSRSLLGLWSTLKDAMNLVVRAFGEGLMPIAKAFVAVAISVTERVRSLVESNKTLAGAIFGAVSSIVAIKGVLLVVVPLAGKMASMLKAMSISAKIATAWNWALSLSIKGVAAAFKSAMIATGFGAVLVALGTSIILLIRYLQELVRGWQENEASAKMLKEVFENLSKGWDYMSQAIGNVIGIFRDLIKNFLELIGLSDLARSLSETLSAGILLALRSLSEFLKYVGAWAKVMSMNLDVVGEILIDSFKYMFRRSMDIARNSFNAILKMVKQLAEAMYGLLTKVPETAISTSQKLWNVAQKLASGKMTASQAALESAVAVSSGAANLTGGFSNIDMPTFTDLFAPSGESERLKERIGELLEGLRVKVEQMITLNEWGDAAYEAGSNFASRFIEGMKKGFDKVKTEAMSSFEGIKQAGNEIMALSDEIDKLKDNRPELEKAVSAFMERNPEAMQMQIDTYREMYAEMLKLKELEDKRKQAANIREDLKTPMDKYADKLNEVMDLYKEGLLTKEEAFAAAEKYKPQQQAGRRMEGFSGLRDFSRQIQQSILGNQQAQRDQERNQSLKRLIKINEDMHKAIKEKEEGLA